MSRLAESNLNIKITNKKINPAKTGFIFLLLHRGLVESHNVRITE